MAFVHWAVGVTAVALACGACGGAAPDRGAGEAARASEPKRGGALRMLARGDADSIDPGITYNTAGYLISNSAHRPLVNYQPDDPVHPVPDLAETLPVISADGKVVTFKLRRGVRFSPPVAREVTSADVKYAIERGFFKTVNNPYVGIYFADLVGAEVGAEPGTEIPGIETPDGRTVVFRLTRSTGGALAGAVALPISAPVPEEYAAKFDRETPSSYGRHQVATGPYMIENDADGNAVGYEAGNRTHLVRNPNWDAATDYKPAYVDEITIETDHSETTVASRRILAGSGMVSQLPITPQVIRETLKTQPDQIEFLSTGMVGYFPLNNALEPFDDVDVRRAVIAGLDREGMRIAGGGQVIGPHATHFLPPGIPGFEEAGGLDGPGSDFLANPKGDKALAARYFRAAGYASGRYEGDAELLMVALNGDVNPRVAAVMRDDLEEMGFKVRLRLLAPQTFFGSFCQVPGAKVNICVGWGWIRDFPDGQTILEPSFSGDAIRPQGNTNPSQFDDPAVNSAIERARTLIGAGERAQAWAEVDRMITEQAAAVPGLWYRSPLVHSKDVVAVSNPNIGEWDFTYTWLR
jgi:peptide/nickel transport system substrate-binding protein